MEHFIKCEELTSLEKIDNYINLGQEIGNALVEIKNFSKALTHYEKIEKHILSKTEISNPMLNIRKSWRLFVLKLKEFK